MPQQDRKTVNFARDIYEVLFSALFGLGIFFAFYFLVQLVFPQPVAGFDTKITSEIINLRSPVLTQFMLFITMFGKEFAVLITLVLVGVFIYRRKTKDAALTTGLMIGTLALNYFLKDYFGRARPTENVLLSEGFYSFPSGHTMTAFTLFVLVIIFTRRYARNYYRRILLYLVSILLIIGVGFSRVYLGVHYPTDIIAGYLAAAGWLVLYYGIRETLDLRKFF